MYFLKAILKYLINSVCVTQVICRESIMTLPVKQKQSFYPQTEYFGFKRNTVLVCKWWCHQTPQTWREMALGVEIKTNYSSAVLVFRDFMGARRTWEREGPGQASDGVGSWKRLRKSAAPWETSWAQLPGEYSCKGKPKGIQHRSVTHWQREECRWGARDGRQTRATGRKKKRWNWKRSKLEQIVR